MPTLDEMVNNVFLRLGDPRSNRPGYFQVLNTVCTNVRTIKRHQHNTSNLWNYSDTIIQVVTSQPTYQITAADFGTPLSVITWAPNVPTWISRPVYIYEPQNLDYAWGLPQNAAAWFLPYDGSNCTAQRCSFQWQGNVASVTFLPTPMTPCQYKIRYLQSANGVNTAALTSSPLTNEDADLAETRSALGLLPLTEWNDPSTKDGRAYNAERRKDLATTLQGEEAELRRQFEAAQLTPNGPRIYNRWSETVVG